MDRRHYILTVAVRERVALNKGIPPRFSGDDATHQAHRIYRREPERANR